MAEVIFFIAAIGAVAGAVGTVALRNPFYSVLALVCHLLALAALFLLLRAEFVAAAQVVVYAGAVMVLYVFVVAYVGGSGEPMGISSGATLRFASLVFALVAIAIVLLAWRRRPYELFVLLFGTGIVYAGVHITKEAVDRPRPAGSLVETMGSSLPSGHAAYATIYVVLGIIAARILSGIVSQAALVIGTVVVAAIIGGTRVYLGAHYYSDVVAGWALGACVFGACGIVALVVSYLRQNGRESRPAGRPEPAADHG